jgi:hypothetical protein
MSVTNHGTWNPEVDSALRREDVQPHVKFTWYKPGKEKIMEGTFISSPEYSEGKDRWTVQALPADSSEPCILCLYDMGITPDGDGETWSGCTAVELVEE